MNNNKDCRVGQLTSQNDVLWIMNLNTLYNYVDNDPGHDYDRGDDNDVNENNE